MNGLIQSSLTGIHDALHYKAINKIYAQYIKKSKSKFVKGARRQATNDYVCAIT